MLSPRRAVSRSLAELPGEVSGVGLVMLIARHQHTGKEGSPLGCGHTEAPDLSGSHYRQGAAAAAPDRRRCAPYL